MPKKPDPELIDDENPEWSEADFARAKSFSELPENHALRGIIAQNKEKKKVPIQLSAEVVEKMQSTGEGWELRVEEAVRQWLARQGKRRKVAS
ncbi:MAG: BrnA antitoxin family protein [Acidobacteriaceae bacterium]|jgi:uncharacterized protein (DUF4415 family)